MGCKTTTAITWTQLELEGLLEDEDSHVNYERAERHLALHPFHLTDLNAALREILSSSINTYDQKIDGIVLSYKNPRLLSRMGTVLYDACFIHIDVAADFYVFRPKVGDTLKGIVNKKSQGHVGILVHKTFNATIPKPHDDEDWPGNCVQIGQEVRFTVSLLNLKDRLPYIRGTFDEREYLSGCQPFVATFQVMKKVDVQPKKVKFSYNDDSDVVNNETDSNSDAEVTPKKLKKLKKEKNVDDVDSVVKSKKKRKVEQKLSSSSEEDVEPRVENQSREDSVSDSKDEFLPGKLKFNKQISNGKSTSKRTKKINVKSEDVISETESETPEQSRRSSQDFGTDDEHFSPKKQRKLKQEAADDNIKSSEKVKTKLEVEITDSIGDFDSYRANGDENLKNESADKKKIKKRQRIKAEVLSSESESQVVKTKRSKPVKVEPNDERKNGKRHVVENESSSSDGESFFNEKKRTVMEKTTKKRRIKTEVLTPETYD